MTAWYVETVDGRTGRVVRCVGPVSEAEAADIEKVQRERIDSRIFYVRRYDEDNVPAPPQIPYVGKELTIDELAKLISGDRPPHMHDANLAFLKSLHMMLADSGVWGWPGTMTFWIKTEKGFRRYG